MSSSSSVATASAPAASTSGGAPAPAGASTSSVQMTHRQIMEALVGLLTAMFVSILSNTIVSNALPRIVHDLGGNQTQYTWVVVASMLAMTASTPIWGKLADLYSQKLLVQVSLAIFAIGSVVAGSAHHMGLLIGARAIQGLGMGGITALVQTVMASMIPPRERGRYSGYIGAVFGIATVAGPLVGGFIVDSPLGWRWCFWISVPVAVLAFIALQLTLKLTHVRRQVNIDYLGAVLIVGGVSVLLAWVTLGGHQFAWTSTTSWLMIAASVVLIGLAILVEAKFAKDPIIPLRLFKDRTTTLATLASVMVGMAMFGATVYLQQYFQIARAMTPTKAGLMSICMVAGLTATSTITGRIISRHGYWKRYLVGGSALTIVGMGLLATIDEATPLWIVGLYMVVLGAGVGGTMQNLVLAVQNNARMSDMGAVSSLVNFFRSMGGSIGVAVLGAVLSNKVQDEVKKGLEPVIAQMHGKVPAGLQSTGGSIPRPADLPQPIRGIVEHAFGLGAGHVFLVAMPFAVAALVLVLFIKEVPLRTHNLPEEVLDESVPHAPGEDFEGADAEVADQGVNTDAGAVGTTTSPANHAGAADPDSAANPAGAADPSGVGAADAPAEHAAPSASRDVGRAGSTASSPTETEGPAPRRGRTAPRRALLDGDDV